ncbi:general stress protein [Paenarthrobacter sp. PH39-S1]|uniref:general stress protein n=1 Tax=Paenarthrobacter sp. PH39-S1 TaxID=3046204 RepID=UPI0024B8A5D9|nr:general stress protein [Paenarthrobacter sp. PH39-S1]MDJ0355619.1 ECF transporter S component [Paenarthrobacter sp. PH39-S1]
MANLFGRTRGVDSARAVPVGDTVGSYTSYLDAQKAVDYLADQKFPVQQVSIVGNDLKMVERVTGKLSYPRVALSGALTGAWFGLFVGVLLSFFASSSATGGGYFSMMTSILMGAAFWMLFGIASYAMQRGKRDFTSTSQVLASSYDVIVGVEVSSEARRLLSQLPMSKGAAHPAQAGQLYQPPAQRSQPIQPPPARPNGWTDPYGSAPEEDRSAGSATGQETPVEGAVVPATGKTPGTYSDLPDGRPQYGIRLPQSPENPPAAEVPPTPEQDRAPVDTDDARQPAPPADR